MVKKVVLLTTTGSNQSWTVPSDLDPTVPAVVTVIGAGGGGARIALNNAGAGGGGGGISSSAISLQPNATAF